MALTAALCIGSGPRPAAAGQTVVTDLRVGENAKTTRFVLDLSDRVEFRVFTLADPYRVVIDLPAVGWRLPVRPLPERRGLLAKLRYGLFKPGTSRVVLDMNGPAAVDKAFLLVPAGTHAYRLVLDLVPTSRAAFLKRAGRSDARAAFLTPVPARPRPGYGKPKTAVSPLPMRKPRRAESKPVIVIDPGHGGVDPGTTSVGGIYEKHVTLSVAREMKAQLERTGRFRVVLTRGRDIFLRLRDRVAKGRDADARLFISIHADAIKNRTVRGLSVYTLSERASDTEAEALAEKENKADLIAGIDLTGETPEVTNILIDLAQRESMNESVRFASLLIKELRRKTRVLRRSHRFAGFAVLKAPDVPSVLMEVGFLSNRADEKALRSKKYRAKLAAAVVRAVDGYFARVEEATRK
jgi:N-acetylmuramoyl-L-alanine amidase